MLTLICSLLSFALGLWLGLHPEVIVALAERLRKK
jgi:hypothetical protein